MLKSRFNRYGGQAGSRTSEKNISTVWVVGQSDNGQLGCGTSLVQHFGSLKVGCRTCDTGQCKWLYKRLQMYRNLQKQSSFKSF